MTSPKPIMIVGGGLAGLTLGIGLRQRGVPVALWEAGHYPRHRVCGEFISGNGAALLKRLGLQNLFDQAGAFRAETATFISGTNHSPVRKMPAPALCLSRYEMDSLLAKEFQRLGGELRMNARWLENKFGEGIVRASGRRAQPKENGWRWFGLKAHATDVNLMADLEMHVSTEGYVGLNRINGGEVNVCGLFRTKPNSGAKAFSTEANEGNEDSLFPSFASVQKNFPAFQLLCGKPGSPLHERLASARFDEKSFCSVAGLSLKPHTAAEKNECCIGDAVTMIPPVTGNGMSMAFESAEIAIGPLARYGRGEMSWVEAQRKIACACDAAFATRLKWARLLQWLMFSPVLRTPLGAALLRSDWVWRLMFAKTR
jgi:2-polyprenyl-6-methoxyphenol hydroxylase-like FAD-dependent oxidoreductase